MWTKVCSVCETKCGTRGSLEKIGEQYNSKHTESAPQHTFWVSVALILHKTYGLFKPSLVRTRSHLGPPSVV